MACIYAIRNKINGKMYVGQTVSFETRMKYHFTRYSSCHAIHSAILKYGKDSFETLILEDGIDDQDLLNDLEEYMIWKLMTVSPGGYSIRSGGNHGGRHSEETKRRISILNSKREMSESARVKISEASKLMWQSQDFKKRHSERMKEVVKTEEWRSKNDIKARWVTRMKNNPLAKEQAKQRLIEVCKSEKWLESNRRMVEERRNNPNWVKSIENNKVKCMCVETGVVYESQKKAAIELGIFSTCINRACRFPTRTAGGFHWVKV